VRGFAPTSGRMLWEFDCNPKLAQVQLGGRGTRNDIVAPIVVADGKVFVGVGQDPEHGEGVGHIWCIDPAKANDRNIDLTPINDNFDPQAPENRNSALVWHYGGIRENARGDNDFQFRRTLACCAIADGLCFTADLSGFIHCLDAATGKPYWEHDVKAAIWASPLWVDGKIYLGDEDGKVTLLEASKTLRVLAEIEMGSAVYMPVVAANGVLYVQTRDKLYAIQQGSEKATP